MTDFEDGIVDLWPTKIVRRRLADFEGPTQGLVKLVRELEKQNRDLTTDYLVPDLFNMDHPAELAARKHQPGDHRILKRHRHFLSGQLGDSGLGHRQPPG